MIVLSLYRGLLDNRATMRMIGEAVAAEHGLTLADLMVQTRRKKIAKPRQIAMARMHATGRYSNQAIANFFGLKDHTTVVHARRVSGFPIGDHLSPGPGQKQGIASAQVAV